ncbi:polycystin family member [Anaeramoeba flamelloides]|uniref:Polycystin family member n=1 Tax=Anaeramoeba flamelloides TaxID=1746091 RepID=A0ABQ8XY42_9EUKA|nr:polycystin family member [Anaeramoeba flamelloides]
MSEVNLKEINIMSAKEMLNKTPKLRRISTRGKMAIHPFAKLAQVPSQQIQAGRLLGESSDDESITSSEIEVSTEEEFRSDQEITAEQQQRMKLKLFVKYLEKSSEKTKLAKELALYVLFLIFLFCFIILQRNVEQDWEMDNGMRDLFIEKEFPRNFSHVFKNFFDVGSVEELWQWAKGPLTIALDGDGEHPTFFHETNVQVGALIIRQHRIDSKFCSVPDRYQKLAGTENCFQSYTEAFKSRKKYGNWEYTHASETGIGNYWGKLTTYYGGGGFIVYINKNSTDIEGELESLETNNYIDKSTRVVFFHLFFFNPNNWNFGELIPFLEFGAGGMIMPRVKFRIFQLDLYQTTEDKIRIIFEIGLFLFFCYFSYKIYKEYLLIYYRTSKKWAYFNNFWNTLDVLNIGLFWAIFFMLVNYLLNKSINDIDINSNEFVKLSSLSGKYTNIYNCISFNLFMSIIKIFKYFRMNRRMSLLWQTLARAFPNLIMFSIFFIIIFLAFSITGVIIFGPSLTNFRDITASLITSFRMALGEVEYDELKQVNRILGPLYFLFFTFFVIYTLLNMFLAILNDAYEKEHKQTSKDQINKAFMKQFGKFKGALSKVKKFGKKSLNKAKKSPTIDSSSTSEPSDDENANSTKKSQNDIEMKNLKKNPINQTQQMEHIKKNAIRKLKHARKKSGKFQKFKTDDLENLIKNIPGAEKIFDNAILNNSDSSEEEITKIVRTSSFKQQRQTKLEKGKGKGMEMEKGKEKDDDFKVNNLIQLLSSDSEDDTTTTSDTESEVNIVLSEEKDFDDLEEEEQIELLLNKHNSNNSQIERLQEKMLQILNAIDK